MVGQGPDAKQMVAQPMLPTSGYVDAVSHGTHAPNTRRLFKPTTTVLKGGVLHFRRRSNTGSKLPLLLYLPCPAVCIDPGPSFRCFPQRHPSRGRPRPSQPTCRGQPSRGKQKLPTCMFEITLFALPLRQRSASGIGFLTCFSNSVNM